MSKDGRKFAFTALLLGIIGYVTGILTAPKSGKETRKDIQNKAIKAKTEAEKKLKTLHSELSSLIEAGTSKVKIAKKSAQTGLSSALDKATRAKEKAREVLSAVHEGDADDKDLQKAIDDVNSAIDHLKKYVSKDA